MSVALVVPTIREDNIQLFLEAWAGELVNQQVIVVEDNPEATFNIARDKNVIHLSWADIDKELGRDSWIIPRRSDCIRSFGYYRALALGAEVIITLDDDCYPSTERFVSQHLERLTGESSSKAWISTGRGLFPRGMPYHNLSRVAECVINHGLWDNVPDLDAVTELTNARRECTFEPIDQVFPPGVYFPMCGMNLAFKRVIAPSMYFLLMGKDYQYDRFGDIWCGVMAKKICDHLGYAIRSGAPRIEHRRASNVWANLEKEVSGYRTNETFWQAIDDIVLTKSSVRECYVEIADKLTFGGEYWQHLRLAMHIWADLLPATEGSRGDDQHGAACCGNSKSSGVLSDRSSR